MNPKRPQDLAEAFANIISMMLGMIRAYGWRCLLHLPELWQAQREIREMGEAFAGLLDDFRAGLIVPPAPLPALPEQEAEYAYPPATPRLAATSPRQRRAPSLRRPRPATHVAPVCPRAATGAWSVASGPLPSHRVPAPFSLLGLPTVATGRSC